MELDKYFRSFIDSSREAVFICNMDYRIIYINLAASTEYAQYGGYEMVGKELHTFLDFEDETKINMVIEWFRESKENNWVFVKHIQKSDMDVYITALRDENGELIGFCNRRRYRTKETAQPYDLA